MVQDQRSMWKYARLVQHRRKFIQYSKFTPEEEHLKEATQQIKSFLEKLNPTTQGKREDDG